MTDVPVALLVLVAVIGISSAAALSAGEVAVVRVSRAAVTELFAERSPSAERVRRLTEHPARVAAAAAFVRLLAEMTGTVCIALVVVATGLAWWAVLLVSVAVCALVAFLLVRASPRTIGRRHPVAVLTRLSRLLAAVNAVAGRLGAASHPGAGSAAEDEDELRDMVQRVSESDVIEDEEREMFRSVLELGETLTREVMVPRTDMVTAPESTPLRKALALLLRSGFSRIPLVGDSVDDLRGVLYLKDVVGRLPIAPAGPSDRRTQEAMLDAPASSLARPAVFVPESKPVDELLRELQSGSSHMAMVVDEYGGIAGLVTIEDALEEIVGELTDEHDRTAPVVEDLGDGVYRVPARLGRDELGELFDLDVEDEDVDTVGGLLAKALGKVPLPGSAGDIHGLHLVADRAEGRRRQLATVLVSMVDSTDRPTDTTTPGRAPTDNHGATR
ncbi:hemolysin family protein [Cellulomonas fengjieae]|uniref:HlyC/CorC family transporter n=1 Tax=Cellulomonas fengjieae TaxID=2819978 RepID=A0ABS3SE21_9CELL|nr:hemolysin family protein [Cellulomonas fengjieae]MBO3084003.1 HlyC/CorC family transporter [Cellulomonas fengjieae]MBO3101246.1 HlyC/CorC family transporter [Cellulomonas fengjieae]QVI64731.1 HlyC/CorC family transporter [Cellulomonas fengjieae]